MDGIDTAALSRLARLTRVWLIIYLGFKAANGVSSFALQAEAPDADPLRSPLTAINGVLSLASLAVFLVLGFLFLRWIHRVNANAQVLAPGAVSISPGWNVGWFFVPFANLWKPFQGLREVYQAAVDPERPYNVEVPGLFRIWWGCWLVFNMIGNAAFRFQLRAGDSVSLQQAGNVLYGVDGLLAIPLCLALRKVVQMVTDAQITSAHAQAFA